MSEKRPEPVFVGPTKNNCPVCGKPSYSPSGIHPQCAVARADAVTKVALKAEAALVVKPERPPHSKQCPRCRHFTPARRVVCDCGHQFGPKPASVSG